MRCARSAKSGPSRCRRSSRLRAAPGPPRSRTATPDTSPSRIRSISNRPYIGFWPDRGSSSTRSATAPGDSALTPTSIYGRRRADEAHVCNVLVTPWPRTRSEAGRGGSWRAGCGRDARVPWTFASAGCAVLRRDDLAPRFDAGQDAAPPGGPLPECETISGIGAIGLRAGSVSPDASTKRQVANPPGETLSPPVS